MSKTQLVLICVAVATSVITGCASESKKAREDARVEARAQELAEQIVRKVKEVDTATAEKAKDKKTVDNRLVNPPGTIWWSPSPGGGVLNVPSQLYVFYESGRWVSPDFANGNRAEGMWWFTDNSELAIRGKYVEAEVETHWENDQIGQYSIEEDSLIGRGLHLKSKDLGWFVLCAPQGKPSCRNAYNFNAVDEILEMVGGSLEALAKRYD